MECAAGKQYRMPAMAPLSGQADGLRMRGAELEQALQGFAAHVRLIAQSDGPVCQSVFPSAPLRRALNGTEHAALRSRVPDTIRWRHTQACELGLQTSSAPGADDGDLLSPQRIPLLKQVADDGGCAPRQQQFGPAHARRATRAEQHNAKSEFVLPLCSSSG